MPEDAFGAHLETVAPAITNLPRSQSPTPLDADDADTDDEKTLGGSKFNTRRGNGDIEEGINVLEKSSRARTPDTLRMVRLRYYLICTKFELAGRKGINWQTRSLLKA